jgi:hypothetical protein
LTAADNKANRVVQCYDLENGKRKYIDGILFFFHWFYKAKNGECKRGLWFEKEIKRNKQKA